MHGESHGQWPIMCYNFYQDWVPDDLVVYDQRKSDNCKIQNKSCMKDIPKRGLFLPSSNFGK